jgi:uncharacterized protein YndB with AHSA1/START domain
MKFWKDIPEPTPSMNFTILIGMAFIAFLVTLVATFGFGAYGWTLFVGTPFFIGWFYSRLITDAGVGFLRAILWALGSIALCGSFLLIGRLEGLICLLMLLPMAAPMVIGGVIAGYLVRRTHVTRLKLGGPGAMAGVVLLVMPGGLAMDAQRTPHAPLHAVVTTIDVDAPPERVWPHVVSFTELPPPTEWIFKGGVAHPLRARIDGQGVGAVRYCEFSTGSFVEPITSWEPPRRLAFRVAKSPAPLNELNPFGAVHPPHLEGYLASERGEFRLEPLPGGRTRLVGTTWYRHHMFPDRYWQAWSDFIIHRIHGRVLRHIEGLAEAE